MNAITIHLNPADNELKGQSKWWGMPDLPEDWDYPMIPYDDGDDDPLTFICQIRCADLVPYDTENQLPHEGMLYFFAAIDEYVYKLVGNMDHEGCGYYTGLSEWDPVTYRVLYSPTEDNLVTHNIIDENGEPYGLPAEKITFSAPDKEDSFKLLGFPFYNEIWEQYPDYINLLQIDGNDSWGMTLYDCGMICFLIRPDDLKVRRFDQVKLYFHSC